MYLYSRIQNDNFTAFDEVEEEPDLLPIDGISIKGQCEVRIKS